MEKEDLTPDENAEATPAPADSAPPDPQAARLAIVVYDQAIEVDILDCLAGVGIEHYTLWHGAMGAGRTGRREGSPIWPGLNNVLLLGIPEGQVEPMVKALYELRASFPMTPALRIMVGDIQVY